MTPTNIHLEFENLDTHGANALMKLLADVPIDAEVFVNLQNVQFADSVGIGALLQLSERFQNFKLFNIGNKLRKCLQRLPRETMNRMTVDFEPLEKPERSLPTSQHHSTVT